MVTAALVIGFFPLACGTVAAHCGAEKACCCEAFASHEPSSTHAPGCECHVAPCGGAVFEQPWAATIATPVSAGSLPTAYECLPAAVYLGRADFTPLPLTSECAGIIEHIRSVRLLM